MENEINMQILEALNQKSERGLSGEELSQKLPTIPLDTLMNQLIDLSKQGFVAMNAKKRYVLARYQHIYRGTIRINKKGFGFVTCPDLEKDIYVPSSKINKAMDGDLVVVQFDVWEDEGKILTILERGIREIIATIRKSKKKQTFFAIPDSSKIKELIQITNREDFSLVDGYKVKMEIEQYTSPLQAKIISVIGHEKEPGVDVLSKLFEYNIQPAFNEMVDKEVKAIPHKVMSYQRKGRTDLRDVWTCTIDGDDSKDFDDAISISQNEHGYELMVHIADVSYYVNENSALDKEAYERGTSVYVVDRVVPMLPFPLSNGICSLNPNEERLTISCIMQFSFNGVMSDYSIVPSMIISNERMTYNNVNKILSGDIDLQNKYKEINEKFFIMEELAAKIRYLHEERGAIDFDTTESKFVINEEGKVVDIKKRERGIAERIIEDFMISANECVAAHMKHLDLPCVYRIHEQPEAKRVREFASTAKLLGYNFKGSPENVHVKEFQRLLKQAEGTEEFPILSMFMLRSMSKARYDVNCVGHFGLASEFYTHFTSPIRRYPDLLVHRSLRKYLFNEMPSNEQLKSDLEHLREAALHSSEKERNAVDAERDVEDMKMAEYCEGKVGEVYEGTITSVTNFGLFIELANTVEGLVHISSLKNDYYEFDGAHQRIVGQRYKGVFNLGDHVKIKIKAANKSEGTIDFVLLPSSYKTHIESPKKKLGKENRHGQRDKKAKKKFHKTKKS